MLKEVFIEKDQSAWWLTALDYLDRRLDTVATPDRINDPNAAQDSDVVERVNSLEATGAIYFEENGQEVRIEPVAGSFQYDPNDYSVSFTYQVGEDNVTVKSISEANSTEMGIAVYALSDGKEDNEICVSKRYSFYEKTLEIDLSSGATKYVESREGKYNKLEVIFLKDSKTRESIRPSRRDAAVLYSYFKAMGQDDPNWIITPLYNDVRLIKRPPELASQRAKTIAPRFN